MTVRAFRQQGSFEARNQSLLDHSNRAYWPAQVGLSLHRSSCMFPARSSA